ncbi:MAG: lipoyl(octanoyl) transferase LipB, partial [Gammaproteobacteria bacterium]
MPDHLIIRRAGLCNYHETLAAMQALTAKRTADTPDEIWLLQHEPVFTLGLNASAEHLLAPGDIPVVQVDRGGQVTYHGPGQLLAYLLVDIKRAGLSVKRLVQAMEKAIIDTLAHYGIEANCEAGAPGVYVGGAKVASLGLRIKHGCCYHGLALNVCPDLEPFTRINPCGYPGLSACSLASLGGPDDADAVMEDLYPHLIAS